ncbi:MAG: hypothetical protein COC24_014010 [Alphaproteobacteria bacterium]|nr:hypothetical protein [Alphaproteobacteria bacterium]
MSIKSIILASTLMFATGVCAADMRTVESNYGPIEVPVAPQRVYVDSPWILGNVIALGVIPVGTVGFGEGNVDYIGGCR